MKNIILITIFLFFAVLASCQKTFLDKKTDKALLVPQNLREFRALLDNTSVMNSSPGIHIIGDGDFVISDEGLKSLSTPYVRNGYLWKDDLYEGENTIADWSIPYKQIFYSNIVLEGLKDVERSSFNAEEYDDVKGSALFHRGLGHFLLVQTFAKAYDENTAKHDLGIPIRLTSDINERSVRATIKETYDQIINDVLGAEDLLPHESKIKSQPSKHAAWALLARLYLFTRNYEKAELYADQALQADDALIDYATLESDVNIPFPDLFKAGNPEVIYYFSIRSNRFLSSSLTSVVPELYDSYDPFDLRKEVFFRSRDNSVFTFKGSYNGSSAINGLLFGGFANNELYLVKSECLARRGKVSDALEWLNRLIKKRWKLGAEFNEYTTENADEALTYILRERRKELVGRGLRWHDLKRLNQEEGNEVTLVRNFEGVWYTLEPESPRYVLPIPHEEIMNSGIEQNER